MTNDLFQSIEQHNLKRLAELLREGLDPNLGTAQEPSWTPLKAAIEDLAEGGAIEAVILLLRHGAFVNRPTAKRDATPLIVAVMNRQLEAVRILLAAGADPNISDDEGDSPLSLSVEQDDVAMVNLLLVCGVTTINTSGGPSGMTALGRAVSNLSVPIVKLLLEAGGDPNARDADQQTAIRRLPPRETVDPDVWDTLHALLSSGDTPS